MMREILFRGKRVDNGEWVEGFYSRVSNNWEQKNVHFITCFKDLDNGETVLTRQELVIPATIGQYTGVTDKTGKKIFEGDIVKGLFLFGKEVRSQVVFKDGAFGLEWVRGNAIEFNAFTSLCNIEFEVVGNIYEKNQSEEE